MRYSALMFSTAVALLPASLFAAEPEKEDSDLEAFFGPAVELATGYDRPERLAPAVVKAISREDINRIGAISLDEILPRVAGVVVQRNRVNDPVYAFRGVYNELNPHVLVMIDGSPISDPVAGGRPIAWNMLSPAIDHVEVVRGPGSAVFGADAYAGVVNIVTKGAVREKLSEVGAFGGNFGAFGGYALQSFDLLGAPANLTIQGRHTGGDPDQIAVADAQTFMDSLAGTRASKAPARLRTDRSEIAGRLNMKLSEKASLFASYDGFFNTGSGFASTFQAGDFNEFNNHLFAGGGAFETPFKKGRLTIKGRVLLNDLSAATLVAPAGALSPAIPGLLPFDLKTQFNYQSIDARIEAAMVRDIGSHTLRFGGGGARQRGFNILDSRNFRVTPAGLLPTSSPNLVDVVTLGQLPNSSGSKRTIGYAFLQDEWRMTPEVTLTAGLRFDSYSQFGGTLNPRAALVWAPNLTTTVKALYGAAFRAPTFLEYRTNPGSLIVGNPSLIPETIDTLELQVSHRFSRGFSGSVSGFYLSADDTIAIVNTPTVSTFKNAAGFKGSGVEVTIDAAPSTWVTLKGHYAFQALKIQETGTRYPNAPANSAFIDVGVEPLDGVRVNFIGSYVGRRPRAVGDPRPALERYLRSDFVASWTPRAAQGIEAGIIVKNVFNKRYADPTTSFLLAPGDFPREGRSVMLHLSKAF